ncbi:pyruvate phosphate dikinase [Candidatus Peregrinibacteria bacterium]|nr:pyruvate phosphate dikinase [Candidatus Peregrinibacteria bacterium]
MIKSAKSFKFGTKAETLNCLSSLVSSCHVPRFHYFTVREWEKNKEAVYRDIKTRFAKEKVIVRSSTISEDRAVYSMAGFFDSVAHVFTKNDELLNDAIFTVIRSYGKNNFSDNKENQVMVQLMIEDISMSGVVFTQDLNTGAPYYVINYDDQTGKTDTVTAGKENSNRTLLVHRASVDDLKSERFRALIEMVREIEEITGSDALDIEFAVDKNNKVYLLQVRPIATSSNWNSNISTRIDASIMRMKSFILEYNKSVCGLFGQRAIFTMMSDWNPAEMIGTAPRPLALSLYRYLITDYAWREARRQMGYNEPTGGRLMVDICGKPFIDVRLSFNSFLPAGLDGKIGNKLVEAWLNRLSEYKELHDKIEFDIVTTVLTFDFDDLVAKQFPGVLSDDEYEKYKKALFALTDNLISGRISSIKGELEKIEMLAERRNSMMRFLERPNLAAVSALLEDCIKLGTVPFSILARHAFIATSFLRSLVSRGVLSEEDVQNFKKSIHTVASDFVGDIDGFVDGKIGVKDFMAKYGHLRPGTYDILSKRYDQRDDLLVGKMEQRSKMAARGRFEFSSKQIEGIEKLLKEFSYSIDVHQLIFYIKESIAAREYAKFIFTKNISDALEMIVAWGKRMDLSREDLSYLEITDIMDALNVAKGYSIGKYLKDLSGKGRVEHEVTSALKLPYLIEYVEDVSIVPLLLNKPNFITKKTARGRYIYLDSQSAEIPDLNGKIVVIEGADPGYDWIFSRQIVGLITKYGGANSHMAIRCAEFGLPAAIGCGEQIFDKILRSNAIELNCSEERIESVEI